jgi:hypothetical protein
MKRDNEQGNADECQKGERENFEEQRIELK